MIQKKKSHKRISTINQSTSASGTTLGPLSNPPFSIKKQLLTQAFNYSGGDKVAASKQALEAVIHPSA
jgi:hypothetical protein